MCPAKGERREQPDALPSRPVSEQGSDPSVQAARARISALDGELVALVNERLALVRELHAYKRAHGAGG